MDIIIKESGVAKPLVYMDTATGTECTLDILQMMGAFSNGTITYNEHTKQNVLCARNSAKPLSLRSL